MRAQDTWTVTSADGRRVRSASYGKGRRWVVRYTEDGHRRGKRFATRDAAESWIREYERPVSTKPVLVGELLDAWLDGRGHLRASTIEHDHSVVRSRVRPEWGHIDARTITRVDVQKWVSTLPVSAARVKHCWQALHAALDIAVDTGRLSTNPAAGVRLPRSRPREGRFFTDDQVRDLIEHASGRERRGSTAGVAIELLALTGMRIGEAVALDVADLDVDRRRIRVKDSKTHRARDVAVPASVVASLVAHLGDRRLGPLLVSSRGKRWTYWGLRQAWGRACDRVGLTDARPHDLRHTAVSAMINAGADIKVIQRQVGHATPTMTLQVYGHLLDTALDDVATKMDARWSSQS